MKKNGHSEKLTSTNALRKILKKLNELDDAFDRYVHLEFQVLLKNYKDIISQPDSPIDFL